MATNQNAAKYVLSIILNDQHMLRGNKMQQTDIVGYETVCQNI